jgi:hypothetical protein
MVYAGIMTRNEARGYVNPIDGLDEILQPVNTQTLKQIIDNQIKENQMEIQM